MRTIEEYEQLTDVSKEDLANAWTDERGVKYSADKKRLLKAPEELKGEYTVLPVTEVICDEAFRDCEHLTKAILPEGLKSIGGAAFDGCYGLTDVNIPSSVEFLGEGVFDAFGPANHTSLRSFTFSKSLEYITPVNNYIVNAIPKAEEYVSESPKFPIINGCLIIDNTLVCYLGKDAHVVIPQGVTAIGDLAFCQLNAITKVNIPSSVTEIGEAAFSYCSSLQSIEIPDSVTKIGTSAFFSCGSLQGVVLPKGVTEIPPTAFAMCGKLENIVIPNSITTIGGCAFQNNSALKSIDIPQSVTSIGESAFWRCYALESIDFPASVTSIGDGAFSDCMLLQTINIHGNPVIGKDAFKNCPGYNNPEKDKDRVKNVEGTASSYEHFRELAKVSLEEINNAWKDDRGVKYSADKKRLIIAPQDIEGEYTILPETEVICRMAFDQAEKLTKVVLPEGLQFIGEYAFHYCLGLKSIDIPQSVDYIDEGAFARCFYLDTINIQGKPGGERDAFTWCPGYKK